MGITDQLVISEGLLYVFVGSIGLVTGSFLNVCIYRIPRSISLVKSRSFCPCCRNLIRWWMNIPVFSFLMLRGRCYICGNRIPCIYPAIEIFTAVMFLLLLNEFDLSVSFLILSVLASTLLVISVIDFQHKIIPNKLIMSSLLFFLAWNVVFHEFSWPEVLCNLIMPVLFMAGLKVLGDWFLGKASLGTGDVKLCGVIGLYLGWQLFFPVLFMASCLSLIVYSLKLRFRPENHTEKIPFAPYLSVSAFVFILFSRDLEAYLNQYIF